MGDSYIQAPPDSTGKKLQTVNETIGSNDVHAQITQLKNYPSYTAIADVTPTASRRYLCILNNTGSGKTVRILRAYIVNMQTTEIISGAGDITLKWSKITARSGGTPVLSVPSSSANAAIPSQVAVTSLDTSATLDSSPNEIFTMTMSTFETSSFASGAHQTLMAFQNIANPLNRIVTTDQAFQMPEGKGIMLQQGTETITAGAIRVIVTFELYNT